MKKITTEQLEQYLLDRSVVDNTTGCWNWIRSKDKDGYGWTARSTGTCKAHRLSFSTFIDDLLPGMQILHSCDNPSCINPEHLRQGTLMDNMLDAIKRGRHGKRAKFNATEVNKIRAEFADGKATQAELAKRYEVNPSTISNICTRDTWRHV